ncbi:MAG TPA: VWA domain-containing protein, partial [Planctomycetia bacterium]|nr:VWA domain-containing protein [Planctomycetia bacterium]
RVIRDPGLLEHMGKNLWRVRVFPVPPRGVQKFELTYSEIVPFDSGVANYTYPLKSSNEAVRVEKDFTVRVELKSSAPLKSIYSPSHNVGVSRRGEREATVGFEENGAQLNRDFQLFWTQSAADVGLSLLTHRDSPSEPGYFLLLVSPKVEIAKEARVPRDVVFILDTSGSMREDKMAQARKALEFCLKALDPADRFGLMAFSTTVNPYSRELKAATKEAVEPAVEWVRKLEASGGTAISEALEEGLKMRTSEPRNFTIVFLTDGQPTIGVTDPAAIVKAVEAKNSAQTRIFTFGVGDDVNTHLLDQVADQTRAASVYVRPKEDLEVKVSGFYDKIRHPVLSNLSLEVDGERRFSDVYPPKLPDLFHGGQLVAMGRYTGKGEATIRLKGKIGDKEKEFIYQANLPEEKRDVDFLPNLWARRKIGYLLDQIRLRGENTELRDEIIHLAKRHGIATPYTSYLVVPDQAPMAAGARFRVRELSQGERAPEVDRFGRGDGTLAPPGNVPASAPKAGSGGQPGGGGLGGYGGRLGGGAMAGGGRGFGERGAGLGGEDARGRDGADTKSRAAATGKPEPAAGDVAKSLRDYTHLYAEPGEKKDKNELAGISPAKDEGRLGDEPARRQLGGRIGNNPSQQAGQEAVDLAVALNRMKTVDNVIGAHPVRVKGKSTFVAIDGVWIDRSFSEKATRINVKYLSAAYFAILEKVPGAKDVLPLGSKIVWMAPSGAALVIDDSGSDTLADA